MTTTTLFDGTLGTRPTDQGELILAQLLPPPLAPAASEELKDSAVTLDTDFNGDGYTGYAGYTNYTFDLATGPAEPINPVFPPLDPSAGFTVSFNLAIDSEGSLSNNRAGFSVIAVSSDGQNEIELGFDADRIFAQAQEFVSGEEVEFDTTSPTDYELQIEGSDYALLANDEEILSGSLRNYDFDPAASQPPLPFNPYDLPNMVFLGDNTDQSSATFTLGSVEVETEDDEPPEPANPVEVKVIVENLAPENGTYLTPVWIGFQNGGFDTYDSGAPLTVGGERMAEDGDASELSQEFLDSGYGVVDATIGGGPIAPGETVMETFILDSNDERSRFLDYFSMVIPSNDAFIANGNPEAHEIFDEDGNFIGADFLVLGNEVNDGGTEVNDELPENTAFFGQTMGNTGVTEGGVVTDHPGFNPVGSGGILDDPMFANADFTVPGYEVARITVTEVEEPEPEPVEVRVTIENLAPENGTYLTPVWVGFQDGGFDTYDSGAPLTPSGERLAEDGNVMVLSQEFLDSGAGVVDGAVGDGPIAPGETVMETFILDSNDERSRFLDYFSMVIPSNDAFIANGNPEAHEIFDEDGNFIGADFLVLGNEVNDGGTEVNDELPENTAFFGQTMGNTGVTEGGVVTDHPGFNPVGSGGILDDPMFANADFTVPGYEVARITVTLDTGENNAPEAVDDFVATFSGEAIAVDVLANDNDPDGDDLELSGWDASSEFGGTIALSDGELEYTPAAGFIGTDSFTYTLSDGDLTDTATVSVTVEEEPEPEPVEVKVTYYNLAPEDGTVVSPLWVGFHNGTFDIYDVGSPAPERLERLAEDGDSAILSQEFIGSGYGLVEGRIEGTAQFNAVLPGDSAMETFTLDVNDECECYFSYAAMVLPSNDAFIANNNPEGIEIFDEEGNFIGADFIIAGERVYDAGTEVNDEVPENTALLNQMVPNTGVDENGVVGLHPGFLANGNILTAFPGADFTAPGYQVARITIERDIPIDDPVNLTSVLTGDQEVPPVETEARGTAEMTLNETGDAFSYSITVSGLDFGELIGDGTPQTPSTDDDVTGLHIHNAPRGENGPVVFGQINPNQDDDDISFVLNQDGSTTISGIWEETDPADAPLSDFVDVLQGNQPGDEVDFYWNIHTEEFPSGEIRGQFQIASAPPTVNTPPVASDDRASTDIDTPVEIDVLANDMDADGNPLTLSIVTAPSNGTALVNDQGTPDPSDDDINYTPNSGFQGTDQFAYQADDGNGGTDTATVTVRVGTAPTRDRIDGSGQDDLLIGTPDDDDIRGRAGNDELRGEQGNDLLVGGQNDDTLIGGVDNDILFGGPGNDFFDGGAGDDIIRGGLGQDLMLGGDGADIFVLSTNGAVDSRIDADAILTFEVGIDSIGLTDGLTEADLELQQLGTNTLIRLASNGQYLGHVNRVEVAVLEGSFLSV